MIIRSKAPLRISFCGGGTDVPPYCDDEGGIVLNTTINMFAFGSLIMRNDDEKNIYSYDFNEVLHYRNNENLELVGEMSLIKALLNKFSKYLNNFKKGFDIYLHTSMRPGSGLGSSSAVTVAFVGLMKDLLQLKYSKYDIAKAAYDIERLDMGIKGGKQDQYSSTFGGLNYIEFCKGGEVIVNPLRIHADILNELEYNLILCNTKITHFSDNLLRKQIDYYKNRREDTISSLGAIKDITIEMKKYLLKNKLNDFAELLNVAWEEKKKMNPFVTNSYIDELYETAKKKGAIGGKILGAGGGGCLLLYCPIKFRSSVIEEINKKGAEVEKFSFENGGLQTWEIL